MRLARSSAPEEISKSSIQTHVQFLSLLSYQISFYFLLGPCEQSRNRSKGSAVHLFKFMVKKVTYTFLNIFLFDNKWGIKLWNVIRITHFSFIDVPPSLSDCLLLVRKGTTDPRLHFLLFFCLPGIVSLVEPYARGQSIIIKRCISIPGFPAFPMPMGGGGGEFHFRLHLYSNHGPLREVKSLSSLLSGDFLEPYSLSILLHSALSFHS